MNKVYLLNHIYILDDDYCEDMKLIGVYSSYAAAEEAVHRLKDKPGFCNYPNIREPGDVDAEGFEISEIEIDKDQWIEGYIMLYND